MSPALLFVRRADEVEVAPSLPLDSVVRSYRLRHDHVLVRPYSPRGTTASGLWLERNPHHPRVWGWLLAVTRDTWRAQPRLRPGAMLVLQRNMGEVVAREPHNPQRYPGHHDDVLCIGLRHVSLVIDPPLVAMEEA